MKGSENHAAAIEDMARRIVERVSPQRIILYGSHARHEAGEQSDVDLLVLFNDLPDRRAISFEAYLATIGCAYPKDIVVATVQEFERYRTVVNTLHSIADREGKVLYQRPAEGESQVVFETSGNSADAAAPFLGSKRVLYEGQA